jgi:4-amino-4-deoxy-L-arabinose transferase-like glycosyltransferase
MLSPERRAARIAISAVLAALLYLPGLGRPALWEPDEGRYAEIAREMAVSGDYVTPHLDWELYFEKPPLVYWANALTIRLFGANEFAVRLPAALATAAEVAITEALGEAMFGAAAGLLAALALALSPLVFGFARFATLDPALAFLLTAALGAFQAAARTSDLGSSAGRRWCALSAVLLALGTLAKGPVALALGGAITFIWMLSERRYRDIARFPYFTCAVIFLPIAVPWFVLAEQRNPGFLRFFFVHEHFQRYLESREHGWGPYFFIPVIAAGMWPWLYFVPLGIREMRDDNDADRTSRTPSLRFLIIWFTVIFVFFSIPRSKLGSYILPALPPVAIIAGYGLTRLFAIDRAHMRRILVRFAALNAAIAVIAVAVLTGAPWLVGGWTVARDAIVIAVLIAAGAGAAALLTPRGSRPGRAIGAIAIAMLLAFAAGERMRADAAPEHTYRNLAHALSPYLAPGCVLASYRHYVQSLPFYTGWRETRVEYLGELGEFAPARARGSPYVIGGDARLGELWNSGGCMILIVNRRDLPALAASLKPVPAIVGCEGKKLAIFNGPAKSGWAAAGCDAP